MVAGSRKNVRARLQAAALELYQTRGYEQTTTAEIAASAGVTERTFFRHFPDKREVLFDGEAALIDALTGAVAAAPTGLDAWETMLRAFREVEPLFTANRASTAPKRQIIAGSAALQERELAKSRALSVALAGALQARGMADRLATLAAQIGLSTLTHAVNCWLDHADRDLNEQITQAFRDAQAVSS